MARSAIMREHTGLCQATKGYQLVGIEALMDNMRLIAAATSGPPERPLHEKLGRQTMR